VFRDVVGWLDERARGASARRRREMSERNRLLELLTELAYEKRKVVLSSGKESDFYIDTKQASLTAEGHYLVGAWCWPRSARISLGPRRWAE